MVLYEDLRIYTIWRTDMARSKTEEGAGDYRKSAEEWEILGELAERLHHPPEAVEAYQMCLRVRFSPKAMKGVLKMYESQGRVGEVLQSLIRLIAWQYRWYSEVCVFSVTSTLSRITPSPTNTTPSPPSSSPPVSSAQSATSSKARAPSKSAVSSKPPVSPNLS